MLISKCMVLNTLRYPNKRSRLSVSQQSKSFMIFASLGSPEMIVHAHEDQVPAPIQTQVIRAVFSSYGKPLSHHVGSDAGRTFNARWSPVNDRIPPAHADIDPVRTEQSACPENTGFPVESASRSYLERQCLPSRQGRLTVTPIPLA